MEKVVCVDLFLQLSLLGTGGLAIRPQIQGLKLKLNTNLPVRRGIDRLAAGPLHL